MTMPKVFASALVEENKGLRARIAELEADIEGFGFGIVRRNAAAEMKERCAQVVKQWIDEVGASQHGRDLNTLLAAIRALKDKP